MRQSFKSFTLTSKGGLLLALVTDCQACAAFDPATPAAQCPPLETFKGIWDTGATASVITQNVVQKCGLKPTGMVRVHGVHGDAMAETFLVNIRLPNDVGIANVTVTLGKLTGADLLIGMDIIATGDFAISNFGGVTVFTFRVPSIARVDFVEEAKAQTA